MPALRKAHRLLLDRGVRLLLLPVPLNADCNPAFQPGQTSPTASPTAARSPRLGVAVFLAGGEAAYARYDGAVFASEGCPSRGRRGGILPPRPPPR